jgi:hypothetical protein
MVNNLLHDQVSETLQLIRATQKGEGATWDLEEKRGQGLEIKAEGKQRGRNTHCIKEIIKRLTGPQRLHHSAYPAKSPPQEAGVEMCSLVWLFDIAIR